MRRIRIWWLAIGQWFRMRRLVNGVFYDPKTNRFIQIKGVERGTFMCGGFADYYEDSQTNITRQCLSPDYFRGCVPVGAIDKFTLAHYNNIGWVISK